MVKYRWTDKGFVDAGGNRMPIPHRESICAPMIQSDIEPYRSPMDGSWITSRNEARNDHAKHGTRVLEPSESPTKGKIRNAAFAKKRGLQVSEEYRTPTKEVS